MNKKDRSTLKQRKERLYINEYAFEGDKVLVKTYTKTREELSKIEGYTIVRIDEERKVAIICAQGCEDKVATLLAEK
jgi:hypothetical protein